jgi:hypothetical protein
MLRSGIGAHLTGLSMLCSGIVAYLTPWPPLHGWRGGTLRNTFGRGPAPSPSRGEGWGGGGPARSALSSWRSRCTTTSRPFLLLVALLLAGCGWRADGVARLEARFAGADALATDGGADALVPDVDLGEVEGEDLSGTWAVRIQLVGTMRSPLGDWPMRLENLFLGEVDAERAWLELVFCDQLSHIDSGSDMGRAEVPEALREALAAAPLSIPLQGDDTIPAGVIAWTWGLQGMDDPAQDALPESADEPRVWDQDGDGFDGVTMRVLSPEGDRYMVRRARWELEAATLAAGGDDLRGALSMHIDERAYGASAPLIDQVAPIEAMDGGCSYELVRVPSDYSCEQLRAQRAGLFEQP